MLEFKYKDGNSVKTSSNANPYMKSRMNKRALKKYIKIESHILLMSLRFHSDQQS